jgi:hypothetical protein
VSKVGDRVILEPLEKPPFDVAAWRARLDALGARDFSLTDCRTIHPSCLMTTFPLIDALTSGQCVRIEKIRFVAERCRRSHPK